MQKSKQTYVAPESLVIDDFYEGAICTYSFRYPGSENAPAARKSYGGGEYEGRYGKSTTEIWK